MSLSQVACGALRSCVGRRDADRRARRIPDAAHEVGVPQWPPLRAREKQRVCSSRHGSVQVSMQTVDEELRQRHETHHDRGCRGRSMRRRHRHRATYASSPSPTPSTTDRQNGPPSRLGEGQVGDAAGCREGWLATVEVAVGRGEWLDPSLGKVTVKEWAEQWLAVQVQLKPSTRERYALSIRRFVNPAWGPRPSVRSATVTSSGGCSNCRRPTWHRQPRATHTASCR